MMKFYRSLGTLLVCLLMLSSMPLHAQNVSVSGTINDDTGQPLPGVSILERGTANGTTTDVEGNYTINVASGNSTLVFSFIGYRSQEIALANRSMLNVSLDPDVTALDEVIVTGYSVDKRRELTGSVSTVKSKDLTYAPTGNVEQMLQGRVPGVTVITNGQPGTRSKIRVRGFGSFEGNQPLFIVDGVPTQDVGFLNPDDIETTTILKDAASASIYGARASSGVIVYTTKKGKRNQQKLNVTYDNMIGVTTPGKGQEMLMPQEFAEWTWQAIRNTEDANAAAFNSGAGRPVDYAAALAKFNHPQFGNGLNPVLPVYLKVGSQTGAAIGTTPVDLNAEKAKYNIDPRNGSIYQVIKANIAGTDWYDEITDNAPILRHTLGFTGGGEASRFYIGLGQQNQRGILINNDFKRYSFRANSEFDILKNLRIGENIQFSYIQRLGLQGGDGGNDVAAGENDILQAFRMPSIIPVRDEFGGYAGTAASGFNNPRSPLANRDGQVNNRSFDGLGFGNLYLEFDPIPSLTLRTSIGGSYNSYFSRGYTRWQYENSENNSAFGFNQGSGYGFGWVFTNTATFKKAFDVHNVEFLLGQEALNTGAGWNTNQSGLNPFSWDPNYVDMTNVTPNPPQSSQYAGVAFSSLFANLKYAFKEKYILGAVIRRDGSSRFGKNNRYGVFPAVSAAWRISDESFMQDMAFISDLKIRGGYGAMGNSNNVDPYNQYSLYGGSVAASSYDITGSNNKAAAGFYRTRIGNDDAKWETSITKNIGIDGNLFDGKLDLIIDFWQKDTQDLLYQLPITATAGSGAAPPSVNIAKMVNKGIDIYIGTKGNITNDITFDLNVTGSFLKNEISEIAPGQTYLTRINPGFRGITPIRNQLGYSISSFYGYQTVGLWKSQEEVNTANAIDGDGSTQFQSGAAPGRFRYSDINGDGVISTLDRTYLGSPVPKFTGGMNFVLRMKGFDFEAYLYTSLGNKIFNQSKWFTDFYPSFQGAAISARVKDSWSPTNLDAEIPVFESASNFSTNTQASSFYVEDGSYLRLQNLSLGYTIPANVLDRLKMNRVRLYIAANNIFTITKYNGLDPAVGGAADTNFGIDVGNYPVTRSYTAGINIGF